MAYCLLCVFFSILVPVSSGFSCREVCHHGKKTVTLSARLYKHRTWPLLTDCSSGVRDGGGLVYHEGGGGLLYLTLHGPNIAQPCC